MGFPTDPTIRTARTGKSMIGELEEKARKKERKKEIILSSFAFSAPNNKPREKKKKKKYLNIYVPTLLPSRANISVPAASCIYR